MVIAIIAAEIAFWVCLILGFFLRYGLQLPRVGIIFLIATPLIDLVLLVFSFVSLQETGKAEFMHGFAAFYISFSLVFGRDIIEAIDRKVSRQTSSNDVKTDSREQFRKCLFACAITAVILVAGIFVAGLDGSFWLTYWIIAVVFLPAMWWGTDRFLQHRQATNGN